MLTSEIAKLKGDQVEFLPEVDINIDFIHFAHEAPEDSLATGFPPEFIASERLRVDAYRRLATITSENKMDEFREELEDRYGNLPEQAKNMLDVTLVKVFAAKQAYTAVHVEDGKVSFKTSRKTYRRNGIQPTINYQNPPNTRLKNLLDIARLLCSIDEVK